MAEQLYKPRRCRAFVTAILGARRMFARDQTCRLRFQRPLATAPLGIVKRGSPIPPAILAEAPRGRFSGHLGTVRNRRCGHPSAIFPFNINHIFYSFSYLEGLEGLSICFLRACACARTCAHACAGNMSRTPPNLPKPQKSAPRPFRKGSATIPSRKGGRAAQPRRGGGAAGISRGPAKAGDRRTRRHNRRHRPADRDHRARRRPHRGCRSRPRHRPSRRRAAGSRGRRRR